MSAPSELPLPDGQSRLINYLLNTFFRLKVNATALIFVLRLIPFCFMRHFFVHGWVLHHEYQEDSCVIIVVILTFWLFYEWTDFRETYEV